MTNLHTDGNKLSPNEHEIEVQNYNHNKIFRNNLLPDHSMKYASRDTNTQWGRNLSVHACNNVKRKIFQ